MAKSNLNMPVLNINQAVDQLSMLYISIIKGGLSFAEAGTMFLMGSPGLGKSMAIYELGKNIEQETGKKVYVRDIRLSSYSAVDISGLPVINKDRTETTWIKPEIFSFDESDSVVNILFLDELNTAPPSLFACAMKICLDRYASSFKIPDNTIIICAGNKLTDRALANRMPSALTNRMIFFEIVSDSDAWMDWAVKTGINSRVTGFLSFRPDYLNRFDPANEEICFCTPRSWHAVSKILNATGKEPREVSALIQGSIGSGAALEFIGWCDIFADLPKMKDIFSGKGGIKCPTKPDQLYAVSSAMVYYAAQNKDRLDLIENAIEFAIQFPAEFAYVFIKNLMSIEKGYKEKLMTIPAFFKYISSKGAALNGVE